MSSPARSFHHCTCAVCQRAPEDRSSEDSVLVHQHHAINALLIRLNEPQRRWYVGSLLLAPDAPTEGQLSAITGMDEKTIRRGCRELQGDLSAVPPDRLRKEGGGRFASEKKTVH